VFVRPDPTLSHHTETCRAGTINAHDFPPEGQPLATPFSGMDPYLEHPAFWRDFHQNFLTYWRDCLSTW
jgi:hypothetical protein